MTSRTQRDGDVVRRPMERWSPAIHGLLRHLEVVQFPAPRLVGVEDGTELLSWIEGESGSKGWAKIVPEDGLRRWASFLGRYHDAVRDYQPPANSEWSSGVRACAPGEVVCHGDFGPWNGVWRGEEIVGLLDFDHAVPAPSTFDVDYALEYTTPFRDDEECLRWLGFPAPPDRRHRIAIFCDAYGVAVPDDIVARVAERQRRDLELCSELGHRGIEPQATWIRQDYLDTLRGRIAWTESFEL